MAAVVVVDYDPYWPQLFDALRTTVAKALGDIAVAIEHVGSTSVPGLAAKPVIDIDVVVQPADIDRAIAALDSIGYVHRGNLGIPQREAFHAPEGSPRQNLYVCPTDSPALMNHIGLRDHLRSHPAAATEYGKLKKRLAAEHDDVDTYCEAKTPFISAILQNLAFSDRAIADIQAMNRADE